MPPSMSFAHLATICDADSCSPNCHFVIGGDLACGLIASRDIAEGESINFDYDQTEDDLRIYPDDRGGFECHCGAAECRKYILGKLYSPPPGGPPAGEIPEGAMPCATAGAEGGAP